LRRVLETWTALKGAYDVRSQRQSVGRSDNEGGRGGRGTIRRVRKKTAHTVLSAYGARKAGANLVGSSTLSVVGMSNVLRCDLGTMPILGRGGAGSESTGEKSGEGLRRSQLRQAKSTCHELLGLWYHH